MYTSHAILDISFAVTLQTLNYLVDAHGVTEDGV